MKVKKQIKPKMASGPLTAPSPESTRIHNIRFYNLAPRAIRNLAYNRVWQKLALSRDDGSIEIWDIQYAPCFEKCLLGSPGKSVEGLAWSGERLFSVGKTAELIEWNTTTLQPRRRQLVTGNSIWCIDINARGTELALGTGEGYINLYDVSDDDMVYKRLFERQEGRVLCCRFDSTGDFLVSGSVGAIRIWDVSSGHALHRISMGKATKHKDVIVWSLAVLKDFTIVAGDSRGVISVWDGRNAAQLESHQVLKADILTLAVNEQENFLMCAGVEPIIRIYAKTKIKRDDMVFNRWVKFLQRNVHDHDVTTLINAGGNRIISGSVDGYLGISSISKQCSTISKYGPFLKTPVVSVSPTGKLVMFRYTNYLEIWRLGSTSGKSMLPGTTSSSSSGIPDAAGASLDQPTQNAKLLALHDTPEKVLELKSKHGESIVCAAISPDGQLLAYSTSTDFRLFRFTTAISGQGETSTGTQLTRVKNLPEEIAPASHLQFTADSSRLFTVHTVTREINIFSTVSKSENDLEWIELVEAAKHIRDAIISFHVSDCGEFMAAAGADRTIAVWRIYKGKQFKHHVNLPRYVAPTTALALDAREPRLVAAFSNGKIIEYDLENLCFSCTDQQNFVDGMETHCVSNVVVDPRNANVLVLHNDGNLFVLEKCKSSDNSEGDNDTGGDGVVNGVDGSLKKARRSSDVAEASNKVQSLRLKFQKAYQHCIHLSWLADGELILVGVNPLSLIEQLPGAFRKKKFGLE